MSRGPAKSIETQLAEIEAKKASIQGRMEKLKNELSSLDKKSKTLRETNKQKQMEEMLTAIQSSGHTTDDVLAALANLDADKKGKK